MDAKLVNPPPVAKALNGGQPVSPPLHTIAESLVGKSVAALEPVGKGGNNRLYRLTTRSGERYALKRYPRIVGDARDRQGVETAALRFLARHGVRGVPRWVAGDEENGCALLTWVAGEALGTPGPEEIDAALALVVTLHGLTVMADAGALGLASEACLSGGELVVQIRGRLERLRGVADGGLEKFLGEGVAPRLAGFAGVARAAYGEAGLDFDAPIPLPHRTLSPADFGFHNALRGGNGEVVFLDFEYFGWDDPVKLAAEFAQHPGMKLAEPLKRRYSEGMATLFGGVGAFSQRLPLLAPLFGLRWCLILLNEFLPERWARRLNAGAEKDWDMAKRVQLAKSAALLATLPAGGTGGMGV